MRIPRNTFEAHPPQPEATLWMSLTQWCSKAFKNVNVVPPDVGAVHQVNLEYLSRVIQIGGGLIYPDSVLGTDSHTTMINGLGILGWGKRASLFGIWISGRS